MSRKSDFFHACKVDNEYIFEHTEYEWDDIVNAFMAGGIFADKNPKNPWIKIEPKNLRICWIIRGIWFTRKNTMSMLFLMDL